MKIEHVTYLRDGKELSDEEQGRIRAAHSIVKKEGFADLEEYRAFYGFKSTGDTVDYLNR